MKKITISIFIPLMFMLSCRQGGSNLFNNDQEKTIAEKEFSNISFIDIGTVSGSCEVFKHEQILVVVKVEYNYKPKKHFEPVFTQEGEKLLLQEKMTGPNSGWSTWTLMVPENMDIKFGSASGSFEVENISGKLKAGTASGHIYLTNVSLTEHSSFSSASGHIKLENVVCLDTSGFSTASGNVNAENIIVKAKADFSSASGDVSISFGESSVHDIKASSASGDAQINFNGNPITGMVEMKARYDKGDIICPSGFTEQVIDENGEKYIVKKKIFEEEKPVIKIHTASGKAILKK